MQVVVLTSEDLKEELLKDVPSLNEDVIWVETLSELEQYTNADAFVDLLFEKPHIAALQALLPRPVLINSVEETLSETCPSFIRFNGWPTFLRSSVVEASSLIDGNRKKAEEVFFLFHKKPEWLPDQIGFITPRVVSMIINEAFISWKEGVSTKDDIDTAMKLGTNYPYGPFEWAEKIGSKRINALLEKLSRERTQYISSVS
jgi:3-hydroxybutyryl-CoA dehydrogenase